MTKEEIDILWNKAMRLSIEDGDQFTRYRFAEFVAAAERNILAAWMIQFGFATGHGDTMEQLVDALGSEIVDRIEIEIDVAVAAEREACAKVVEDVDPSPNPIINMTNRLAAAAIRARSNA